MTENENVKHLFTHSLIHSFTSKKLVAFTLAEVLITLGIIGVVAAMTIPTLISNYRKSQLEAQIKETYSSIQQTMRFMEDENLSYDVFEDNSDTAMQEWFDSFIAQHMKVESVCLNKSGCWHKAGVVKMMNGANISRQVQDFGIGGNCISFTTAKGAWISMDGLSQGSCIGDFGVDNGGNTCLGIIFDANGAGKPNILGKDLQAVVWTEKGLVPAGYDRTKEQIKTECYSRGYQCLNEIIDNDWKIPDTLWKKK